MNQSIAEGAVAIASAQSQHDGGPPLSMADFGSERDRLSARYETAEGFDEALATDDGFLAEMMVDAISERQWRQITDYLDNGDGLGLFRLMWKLRDTEHDSRVKALLEDEE